MTAKTKKTLITAGIVLAAIIIIRRTRESNMISDEKSGLLGLGLFGIL